MEAEGGEGGMGGHPEGGAPANVSGAGGGAVSGAGGGAVVSLAELEAETIVRWNAVADARPPSAYDFHWDLGYFPHPTFKMGTPEGYHEFAFVFAGFLEADDNFDFLTEHHLLRMPLTYTTLDSWTFIELAAYFSTTSFGDIPADVQSSLASYYTRMLELDE